MFEGVQKTYEKTVGFLKPLGVEKVSENGAQLRIKSEKQWSQRQCCFFIFLCADFGGPGTLKIMAIAP